VLVSIKNVIFFGAFVLLISVTAQANTLALSVVNGNLYQQTIQTPCVFSNPACQNGGFPTTNLPTGGNVTSYDALSPIYTGSTILSLLGGGALSIGIDINEAAGQGPQTLTLFTMIKNGAVVDTFSFAGHGNVPATNNGNGFADYLLTNFSAFTATDTIQFHFVFNDANDGTENAFVIPQVVTTPEPSALVSAGLAMAILGIAVFNRRSSYRNNS
jgi:hypothetical protein